MAAAAAPQQTPKEYPLHHGVVKSVISGDSVVIRGAPRAGGPPPERTLSLAGITAPRLGRRPNAKDGESKDEPFAWESREFLRKKLVGKEISFTVEYKVPSGREFGTIFLGPSKENITQTIVKEGLASVREGGKGQVTQEQQELAQLAAAAQAAKKGIHSSPEVLLASVRNVVWSVDNLRALVDGYKGKPVDAVVEMVRDGCTLRVFLLPGFQNITVVMSGIKTPGFKHEGDKDIPEPLAEEAKFFTEVRLLQRDVKILLEGVSGQNVLGSVMHPAGSIAELLLESGYARIVDWSFGNVTNGRERLRAAESKAKSAHLRLWADHKVVEKASIADREFQAVVEEVVNPECIVVNHNGHSRKIFLSSIRQPRPPKEEAPAGGATAGAGAAAAAAAPRGKRPNFWEIPWMLESREFLRKRLVGHKVNVHIDFIKPAADGYPERVCATVKAGGANVAEALVSKGLATVVRYRDSDEDRATGYDDLLAAETNAAKNQKGVHSTKDIPVHRINDVTSRAIAEKLVSSFTRAGRLQGVVDHVQSGSRMRVFVPKESCLITVLLAGLSCPRSASADRPGDPFGDEALNLTRSLVLQRDVEIEIEDIDKTGCFVGHITHNEQNPAVALLTHGLSKLHPSAERYKNLSALQAAEAAAKASRKKVWADYVEPVAAPVEDEKTEGPRERKADYKAVTVTDIASATSFWAQPEAAASQLERIMQTIEKAFAAQPPHPGAHTPKRNELVAAKFSQDGVWYRARVVKVNSPTDVEILYVDFGNSESVSKENIAALPPGLTAAGLASEYQIAFLSPPAKEWAADTVEFLRERILNQTVKVNVEYRDGATEYVSVVTADTGVDVGKEMLAQGLAILKARSSAHLQALMATYAAAQQTARSGRVGIWTYGDATEDDAKEFGRGRP